ncbi:gamma-glutamylcyclotransferase [Schlegelella aquatica]|uniref:gamma-glutamylcyclotransferase n=1 Tax=Caldimonas aquatica TaxID=376175 RepID=UPI0037521E90
MTSHDRHARPGPVSHPTSLDVHPLALRDPQLLLEQTLRQWDGGDLWVFGYASLIWNPEVEHIERRMARVLGYHRALRMWSRINRGTPQVPGLVFALMPGGSCQGVVFRVPAPLARRELDRLWQREMPTGVYDPRWLPCRTHQGLVRALGFTLRRTSPNYTGELPEPRLLEILRSAKGRYGTTLEYVHRTQESLLSHGIRDRRVEAVLMLARRHGLLG